MAWVNAGIAARNEPLEKLLRTFNARLFSKGHGPISKSAFSRYAVRLCGAINRLEQNRAINEEILAVLGPCERSDAMMATAELLREHLSSMAARGIASPETTAMAALALERISKIAMREHRKGLLSSKSETIQ